MSRSNENFNHDVSHWNISKVEDMKPCLGGAKNLIKI